MKEMSLSMTKKNKELTGKDIRITLDEQKQNTKESDKAMESIEQ